ncbi:hypothetical protein Taro_011652 [Colocasia esculenta]|uniref:Uncharacterized protein n=1 Tax=Colocasia esculenta TaxID=4460 RepID=A0A843UDB4_COLES|nr:hypothetical protein [Colocasia esculenta]
MPLVIPSRLGITPDHLTRVHGTAKGAVVTSTRLPAPDLVLCNREFDDDHTQEDGTEDDA